LPQNLQLKIYTHVQVHVSDCMANPSALFKALAKDEHLKDDSIQAIKSYKFKETNFRLTWESVETSEDDF